MTTLDIFSLHNKVAVVTGGWGQLGQQFCIACADSGARVAVVDILDRARTVHPEFEHYLKTGKITTYKGDTTNRTRLKEISEEISVSLKTPDILVNASAIDSPPGEHADENGPFEDYPEKSLDRILSVNVKGVFLCCQVFGGAMAEKGNGGSVINIASIYGMVSPNQNVYEYKRKNGKQWYKPAAYSVTKAALLNLTRYLATYWAGEGIRVNTISPAGVFNNQDEEFLSEYYKYVPMGRMAKENEINGTVVFLASDASSYVTGANIVVDGGWTAW